MPTKSDVNRKKQKQPNGAGSITQRKDGTWMARISIGYDPDGKLKRQTLYGKSEKEVRTKMINVLHDLNNGMYTEPSKISVSDWIDTWLYEYKKPSVRPSTFVSYEMNTRRHIKPHIGRILLKDLRPNHIQKIYNSLLKSGHEDGINGLSPKTIRNIHNALHEAMEQALKNGLVLRNVADAITLPRITKPDIHVFSLSEQEQFLKTIRGERLEAAFRLDLATGLRMGELLALRWDDIDFDKGVLRVRRSLNRIKTFDESNSTKTQLLFHETKTKSGQRSIPIPEPVIQDLIAHKSKQNEEKECMGPGYNAYNLVFLSEAGTPVDPRCFIRKFHSLLRKGGLEHTNVHSMRHTFATRLLEAGENVKVVSDMLGHANISITLDLYSHVLPDTKKAAANKLIYLFERKPENTVEEEPALYLVKCS